MTGNQVWFVTGASKGLGLALVEKLLHQGFYVAATSRNKAELQSAVTANQKNFLPLQVNLVDEVSVKKAIKDTVECFGRIDVVVNNAGYGQIGAIEEISDREVRDCFNVNVFGTLNVIRALLPTMRKQKSGHIFNISSISGFRGGAGDGIYTATKFAVTGLTESLAADIAPFGIKATCILPGFFRTKFLSEGSMRMPIDRLEAYEEQDNELADFLIQRNGTQIGDPAKAADVLIHLSQVENPPVHLFLGNDAQEVFHTKIEGLNEEVSEWAELATSTDHNE
ncbi:SDR family oxidoreductase [Priestia sp. OVS21]|nr:SDR family oxidoreductase [Priestia sp. OVS21]